MGGVAVHEAADGDQVGSAPAGGEDYRLQFGMGMGEVGDFLFGVRSAVVGEGDDAPIRVGASGCGERCGSWVRGGWRGLWGGWL